MKNNMVTKDDIIKKLEKVYDPELGIDIWTLGLVYDINIKSEDDVTITLTYTTPMCPFGPMLNQLVEQAMMELGFTEIYVNVTFDPPWKAPDNLREMLGV